MGKRVERVALLRVFDMVPLTKESLKQSCSPLAQVDVPHFTGKNWNYIKGAFMTIDRPYGKVFDFLHHRIGSTHVVHHIDCTIPHYRAKAATEAIKKTFPDCYLYDPTPIPEVVWRVSTECIAVEERGDKWVFVQGKGTPELPSASA